MVHLIIIVLDVEHVVVMETVLVKLVTVELHVNVESVKESQQHVLDMEPVNVMETVHVIQDGQIQSQLSKSVIVQQNVLLIVVIMDPVSVVSVTVMQTGQVNLIVDVLINVLKPVMKIKHAHAMEHVPVFLDSMELLAVKFHLAQI